MKDTDTDVKAADATPEVCDRMVKSVIYRVEKFEVSRSHKRSIGYGVIFFGAFLCVIPGFIYVLSRSGQSGFGKYVSLIISDSSFVIQNWREYAVSTASSLPLAGGIIILFVLFISMNALRKTVKNSIYSNNIKKRMLVTNN